MKKSLLALMLVSACTITSVKSQKPVFGFYSGTNPRVLHNGNPFAKPAFDYTGGFFTRIDLQQFMSYRYMTQTMWYAQAGLNYTFSTAGNKIEMPAYVIGKRIIKHGKQKFYHNPFSFAFVGRFGVVANYYNQRTMDYANSSVGEFMQSVVKEKQVHAHLANGFGLERVSPVFTVGVGAAIHTGNLEGLRSNPMHSILGKSYLSLDAWVIKGKFKKIRHTPCKCLFDNDVR